MPSVKTKFSVGLFVAAGFVIAVIAIIWLGMSHYLQKGKLCVAYFDESVQGLSKDSPVKYRGVPIGRVYHLGVAPDGTLIEAVLQIDLGVQRIRETVAQLKAVGITGSVFVDLDRKKPGEPDLSPKLSFKPRYPVVATKPSQMKRILGDIDQILNKFKKLDIASISRQVKSTLKDLRHAVHAAQVGVVSNHLQASLQRLDQVLDPSKWNRIYRTVEQAALSARRLTDSADRTVAEIRQTASRVNHLIAVNEPALTTAVGDLSLALKNSQKLVRRANRLLQNTDGRFSNVENHLVETLKNLNQASLALNRFLDLIANQPSQLFFGEPPPPRPIERENFK